jgi:AraC-like DNA-binding protein
MQEFKDIKGFEGRYAINKNGEVYSYFLNRLMKLKTSKTGYLVVHLRKQEEEKHPSVHRLVAEHFIDNPDNKPTVNHIDGNKKNNGVENLGWSTHKEQSKHALDQGLIIPRGNHIYSPEFKIKVKSYFLENNCSVTELARIFNISERSAKRFTEFEGVKGLKLTNEDVGNIIKLREQNKTLKEIAEIFNCGISQVHRITKGMSRNVEYLK